MAELNLENKTDELEEFLGSGNPWETERPIDQIEVDVKPRRLRLPTHMSSKLQLLIISGGVTAFILFLSWIFGAFNGSGLQPTSEEQRVIASLIEQKKALAADNEAKDKTIADREIKAGITRFQGKKYQTPGKGLVGTPKLPPKPENNSPAPPTKVRRTTPAPRNVVNVPRTRPSYSRPTATARASKPSGPSLKECADYLTQDVVVPACSIHKITQKKEAPPKPLIMQSATKPTSKPPKPLKLAYAAKAQAKPKEDNPSYRVNFMAGEIQTVDQFEDEFYGSGQSAVVDSQPMKAEVINKVEWLSGDSPVIPLKITDGKHKGQVAEAKIKSMNGLQFTAHVISINGQDVEPGSMEVRQKGTKYMLAKMKTQGGQNFGNRLLSTATAIAGEAASNRLGKFEGGNHLSGLIPNSSGRRGEVTQYLEFKGGVEIVSVGDLSSNQRPQQ